MSVECSTHGGDESYVQNFVKKLNFIDQAEDIDVDGKIIRRDFREVIWEEVVWIYLAQYRD
jgi:hypothetical protein